MENYLLLVMNAVDRSVAAGNNQMISDAQATKLDINIEENEYNIYTAKIDAAQVKVNTAATNVGNNPKSQKDAAALTAAQTAFQNTETEEQTYTQQADSAVQAQQNQTGQDSSTLQQKVQLEAAINQILGTLTSALSSS